MINQRMLGKTGINTSEIGFGAWAISGRGYGATDDRESVRALHRALDLGVDFIDTADAYGDGRSEELIGRVLADRGDAETIVATKFGWDFYGDGGMRCNMERGYVRFAVEQSLRRLGRDAIDIYLIHNSNPHVIEEFEVYETCEALKHEGVIRFWGVSAFYVADGVEALRRAEPDVIQVAYNMLDREAERELFPMAMERGVGVIVREPLASGLLTGKYDASSKFEKRDHRNGWSREYLAEETRRVDAIKFLAQPGRSLVQTAIRFAVSHPAVSVVIPGAKTAAQVEENVGAANVSLTEEELRAIREA